MASSKDIDASARIAALPRRIAVGDLSAMRSTSHCTLASSSAAGTTWFRRPAARASAALKGSPVKAHSRTVRGGTRVCSRLSTCIGNRPSLTSGSPNTTCSLATAKSAMAARPMPPAMQAPLMRATMGRVASWASRSISP